MNEKEYVRILDSLPVTGVYVIREDNHEIQYYNKRVREVAPEVRRGDICHELWKGVCANCPLKSIGDKKQARTINYDNPFGEVVEIVASRILWEDRIPAFLITVSPHEEVADVTYYRVLRVNLTKNTFHVVHGTRDGFRVMEEEQSPLSSWLQSLLRKGYIHEEDEQCFLEFIQLDNLRGRLKDRPGGNRCIYRYRSGNEFRWHIMEIVADFNHCDEEQTAMIYVKDVHDAFKESVRREEINIKGQEIIDALGEMNLGIYIVDLQTGIANVIKTTEVAKKAIHSDNFLWDDIVETLGRTCTAVEFQDEFKAKYSCEAMRQAWKNGEKKKMFIYRARIGENWRYVSATGYFKKNRSGRGYAILTFQDVDDRTRENMLRIQNDRRMAALIKSRYDVINTVDLESGHCERVHIRDGILQERLEGDYSCYIQKALDMHIAEEDRENFNNAFLLENLRKRAEDVEDYKEEIFQYRFREGAVRWVEDRVMYIRQGSQITVNILGRDITKNKEAEEAAKKAFNEKVSIINTLSGMFFASYYVDLEQDCFRSVTQEGKAEQMLGEAQNYSNGIRAYAEHFIHPDDRADFILYMDRQNLLNALSPENPYIAFEYRKMPENGQKRAWIRATAALAETSPDGRPRRIVYVAQDITESKLREEQEQLALEAACEAANRANAAKSEFLSRMSHDIRTPLNAIIGMTAIAGRYLDNQERVADCLGKIVTSSRHLLSLINEVLDMSKIESGKMELTEEEVDLSELVSSLVTMMRPSIEEKNHQFEVHISNLKTEHVIGDSIRLQQVFINILGNAIKYTPPGGKIEMEIREKPSSSYGYSCFEFVFRDTGIGMSREFQKKLFEPFTRAEDSRISTTEGTGLGMTIARNIARMMDGSIEVESEPGRGTQFTVTLMLKKYDADEPDLKQLMDLPVLVADDDETAGQMACLMLDNIGMKSEYVTNGADAVARVFIHHQSGDDYFAVILDWKMPDMDGIETARAIRAQVGPDVPIIILSAYDWSSVEEEARDAGVNGFIAKPLFRSRLVYLFSQFTDREKFSEESDKDRKTETSLAEKRILLVEDNALNREIAEEMIYQLGASVETAKNGKEAVEKFEQMEEGYYDMIVMDIQMPVMNGYEASRTIRSLPRPDAAEIPIVAMTANAFAEDMIQSRNAGMNEHLTKPLGIEDLEKCIRRWT